MCGKESGRIGEKQRATRVLHMHAAAAAAARVLHACSAAAPESGIIIISPFIPSPFILTVLTIVIAMIFSSISVIVIIVRQSYNDLRLQLLSPFFVHESVCFTFLLRASCVQSCFPPFLSFSQREIAISVLFLSPQPCPSSRLSPAARCCNNRSTLRLVSGPEGEARRASCARQALQAARARLP